MTASEPMTNKVAGRYAQALFDLALDGGAVDGTFADLKALSKALDDSEDFQRFIKSPLYDTDAQSRAVAAILEKAGATDLVRRFIAVIVQNRRLFALRDVISAFFALVAKHRGEVTANVQSAHALNDGQVAALKKAIETYVDRDVQLETQVDPSLLGGVVVKVGSRMIDASLRTQLNKLQTAMKEA